ncbi:MAG: hypothetical protein E6248_07095 [Clostridium sp.]|nr:hypothetical protein [Clostridium sp.]
MVFIYIICLFFMTYIIYEIIDIKRKVIRLTQENAVLWEFIKENDNK